MSAADLVLPALLGEALADSSHGIAVGEENWGRILAANTAFASLLGYTPDELLTVTGRELSASPPEEIASVYKQAARPGGRVRARATLRRKDGSLVAIDYWMSQTKVGGLDFVLVVTDPVDTAVPA